MYQTKSKPFYFTVFHLTSEPKHNFRATNPLNCNLMCLKRVADSLNISAKSQLGCRAIFTLEVGSLQATFHLTWQPSLVWVLSGKISESVIDDWCSLGKLQGLTPLPRILLHHCIIGGLAVRLALCTRGRCVNDCNVQGGVRASTSANFQ